MREIVIKKIDAGLRAISKTPAAFLFIDGENPDTWDEPEILGIPVFHGRDLNCYRWDSHWELCRFIPMGKKEEDITSTDRKRFAEAFEEFILPEKTKYMNKEACMKRIVGVCDGCGGTLSAIETIDNSGNQTYWPGCVSCERYTEGVPFKVFKVARQIVEEQLIVPYEHIKPGDEDYLVGQTAGVANILARIEELLSDFS